MVDALLDGCGHPSEPLLPGGWETPTDSRRQALPAEKTSTGACGQGLAGLRPKGLIATPRCHGLVPMV